MPTQLESLGNPTRLRIYRTLVRAGCDGLAVGGLQQKLDIPSSTLSHHCKKLIDAGLMTQERIGATLVCRANYKVMSALIGYLSDTDETGAERSAIVCAVLDASGTRSRPSPMGVDGLPVIGEKSASDKIAYGIPDVTGRDKADDAGRSILVADILALVLPDRTNPSGAIVILRRDQKSP